MQTYTFCYKITNRIGTSECSANKSITFNHTLYFKNTSSKIFDHKFFWDYKDFGPLLENIFNNSETILGFELQVKNYLSEWIDIIP